MLSANVPLEGFKALQGISGPQRFQIHKAYGAPDRLPSAHTCFNQLDLPEYTSKEQLESACSLQSMRLVKDLASVNLFLKSANSALDNCFPASRLVQILKAIVMVLTDAVTC
ncbi:hypothetical protein PR202_ga29966 [Eleusine coracana subsp. coracana]|uniref:HECT-type E3 ubiquitin transferase n=1 Tax=Eleusine coracana subsp. coracana TaxID=191504 RepID=A0AAV5DMT2_ELECO|nr:hypothetical protein PR202_ga29966 [Eleusine coracana subsp. coracana]